MTTIQTKFSDDVTMVCGKAEYAYVNTATLDSHRIIFPPVSVDVGKRGTIAA